MPLLPLPLHPRRSLTFWKVLATLPLLLLLAALQTGSWAQQAYPPGTEPDPPGRVARLNLAEGTVSFAPADAAGASNGNDWRPVQANRPLTSGDRLWSGPRARAELHVGSTAVRMNEETSLDFLTLDDHLTQLRLAQGSIQLRVRALFEGERLEVNTPNLAFVISQPGDYRLDVNPASDTTRVVAQSGSGMLYGDSGVSLALQSQQQGSFSGTQLAPAAPGAALADRFDLWAADRDRREDLSVSARYIPRETLGYQQLDTYGDWQQDPAYGAVWLPRAVPVNWAPYRAGHWDWVSPWGWTWVDDAPWGFAPFHYGRWAQIGPRWAWVPGHLSPRPVYAPALVAFVGDANWTIAGGSGGAPHPALGWFPLAPGEAFRPGYRASPRYLSRVNNNVAVNASNSYRYQRQPAAVTAASRDDFVRGPLMRGQLHALSAADLNRGQLLLDHGAMPQRPQRPDQRERPRLAPAALPPPAAATQAVVRPQGERGNDRRPFPNPLNPPNRADNHPGDPGAGRPENSERLPRRVQSPMPAVAPITPVAPVLPIAPAAVAPAIQPPAVMRLPAPPAPQRMAPEAEQRLHRDQQSLQREQMRQQQELAGQQEQQRRQGEQAQGQQRMLREQAQRQQEQLRQQVQEQLQRHQADLGRQQDQQRRQNEEALRQQQRAIREQAQPPRAVQPEPARPAQEAQKPPPDQRRPPTQDRPPPRPAEAGNPRGFRPEGEPPRNREP